MPTPSTGTFKVLAGTLSSMVGGWAASDVFDAPLITSDSLLVKIKNNDGVFGYPGFKFEVYCAPDSFGFFVPQGTYRILCSPDTANIVLNPGTADEQTLTYAGLPAGFSAASVVVHCLMQKTHTGGSQTHKLLQDGEILLTSTAQVPVLNDINAVKFLTLGPAATERAFLGQFGVEILAVNNQNAITGCGSIAYCDLWARVDQLWITGSYQIQNFSWYIKQTEEIINGIPVNIIDDGDIIPVVDGDPIPDGFVLYGTDDEYPSGPTFTWWTNIDFWLFYIYSPVNPSVGGGTPWTAVGGAPTCSACLTLTLGELTILVANASGIYTLSPGKLNDTVYRRATADTTEIKIPNPLVKIGFVP